MTRMVMREIGRRYIDSSGVQVRAVHGVVYMNGFVRRLRGHDLDLRHELEVVHRILRTKPGVRDVIIEVDIRG